MSKFMLRKSKGGDLVLFFDPKFHGGEAGFAARVEPGGVWYQMGMIRSNSAVAKAIRKMPVVECRENDAFVKMAVRFFIFCDTAMREGEVAQEDRGKKPERVAEFLRPLFALAAGEPIKRCPVHPAYRGQRRPRARCKFCWDIASRKLRGGG